MNTPPTHALALSTALAPDSFGNIATDYHGAMSYLRGESLSEVPRSTKGYVLACYGGRPLGFVKNIGRRANNLYPDALRLRLDARSSRRGPLTSYRQSMTGFIAILRRFVPPYKKYLFLNIFFNLLSAFLTLFSFALIIPILEMLFKIRETGYTLMHFGEASFKDVCFNNFYYFTQELISQWGSSATLAALAAAWWCLQPSKPGLPISVPTS